MTAQQIDALRDIVNKARVTAICKSPAWKGTLRILKRSRLVYRGERSESFDPEKHFNRYTVRYLYLLNIMALELKSDTRIKVEVGQWYRMTGKRLSLNVPPFMLIPRNIRRKVDGFRQSEGEATKQTAQPFTDSLYEVLSRDNDSAELDAWFAEPPLTRQEVREGRSVTDFNPWALSSFICRSVSPTFELFYQEYKRLGLSIFFDPENRKPFESIKKHFGDKPQLLERLGEVLFFTSLYNQGCLREFVNTLVEKEDIYLKASPGEEKVKAHQKLINYIEEFCNEMTEKYLMPAAGRHYKKRKTARSGSSES